MNDKQQFSGLLLQSSWMYVIRASDLQVPNITITAV